MRISNIHCTIQLFAMNWILPYTFVFMITVYYRFDSECTHHDLFNVVLYQLQFLVYVCIKLYKFTKVLLTKR